MLDWKLVAALTALVGAAISYFLGKSTGKTEAKLKKELDYEKSAKERISEAVRLRNRTDDHVRSIPDEWLRDGSDPFQRD